MTKTFDCVEMKRKGAELVQKKIAGMSFDQKVNYWRERSAEFKKEMKTAKSKKKETA